MASIPEDFLDLFEKPSLGYLALHLPGEAMQVTPVWQEWDGTTVNISSVKGRLKDKLARRNPHATLCVQDPDEPMRYLEIRGRFSEIELDVDETLKRRLQAHYSSDGKAAGPVPGDERWAYRLLPDAVIGRSAKGIVRG